MLLEHWGLLESEIASRYPGLGNPLQEPWMRLRRLVEHLPPDSRLWLVAATGPAPGSLEANQRALRASRPKRPEYRDMLDMALRGRITPNVRVITQDEFFGTGESARFLRGN